MNLILGNVEVWHGNLDIIINSDLAVEPLDENSDIPGGEAEAEKLFAQKPTNHCTNNSFFFSAEEKTPRT